MLGRGWYLGAVLEWCVEPVGPTKVIHLLQEQKHQWHSSCCSMTSLSTSICRCQHKCTRSSYSYKKYSKGCRYNKPKKRMSGVISGDAQPTRIQSSIITLIDVYNLLDPTCGYGNLNVPINFEFLDGYYSCTYWTRETFSEERTIRLKEITIIAYYAHSREKKQLCKVFQSTVLATPRT